MTRVGFVGAGRMGLPMARRLAGSGHEVAVLGRSERKRKALADNGLAAVTSLPDVDVVVVCVFTDEQVREVCLDTALPRGATVVVHTTGDPRTVEEIAARGHPVVDAPVSGGPHDIAAGRVTVFAGGTDADIARVRPVLHAYADPVLHVGPLGAGQRVKLVNNALFAAQVGLVAAAVRLGERLGVAEAVLLDALPHGSAASRALTGVAARGSVAAFATAVGDFVGKDIDTVRAVAAELGADLGALELAVHQ
ncbi:NAD(P)-dependent oxidoreductase [Actinophytocola oryzae]|uniref:3-hydroxyisobutyrate dehydrogenase-like beta-hydroxyacid dehydrogenase n=1 Tax=Actinophytocola oryzae TaxID=502181 RepID=A0A4R7VL13_9PSEU|nr:NAD(P)-dependent oxidoreductase [Actinophytocola oryzae]TDV49869.1 3-hydroxyisobutyrate dehydrogenase-like beta-hydroxyacid dehydrogenase [Actinophytocola oryzae]